MWKLINDAVNIFMITSGSPHYMEDDGKLYESDLKLYTKLERGTEVSFFVGRPLRGPLKFRHGRQKS